MLNYTAILAFTDNGIPYQARRIVTIPVQMPDYFDHMTGSSRANMITSAVDRTLGHFHSPFVVGSFHPADNSDLSKLRQH